MSVLYYANLEQLYLKDMLAFVVLSTLLYFTLRALRLGPHYRLLVGRQFSWLLNKYEDLCECAH
jgi:hypothetical protein